MLFMIFTTEKKNIDVKATRPKIVFTTHRTKKDGANRMANHRWIEGVLQDILDYARKNGLTMTQVTISDAMAAFSQDIKTVDEEQNTDSMFNLFSYTVKPH